MTAKQKLVVFSGAGVSAESGVSTFRDSNGLWENHRIEDVCTAQAWQQNPALVLEFYNCRRKQLFDVEPNEAHKWIAEAEAHFDVVVVTQNVDNLHERAGSSSVVHLHGELTKCRSSIDPTFIKPVEGWEMKMGELCPKGSQLRPHIVFFGEDVPMYDLALDIVSKADILLVVGTSLQVYPAAGLIHYAQKECVIYVVDPKVERPRLTNELYMYELSATKGVKKVIEKLIKEQK